MKTYPGDVGAGVGPEGKGPGGLEGLEVLVRLEEGPDQRRVGQAEQQQRGEDLARGGGHGRLRGRAEDSRLASLGLSLEARMDVMK